MDGVTLTPPAVTSIWEYIILLFFVGGGSAAIQKLLSAWKEWSTVKRENSKQARLDDQSVVDNIIVLLKNQFEDQYQNYEHRLEQQELYYKDELENRRILHNENMTYLKDKLRMVQDDNKELTKQNNELQLKVQRYETLLGYVDRPVVSDDIVVNNNNNQEDQI